jgi:hypothetical protein
VDENIDLSKNTELSEALKEFEVKSSIEQMQKAPLVSKDSEIPKMAQWVIKLSGGAIKEQKQAEYVLLGFVFVAIAISLFLIFGAVYKQTGKTIDAETGKEVIPINHI